MSTPAVSVVIPAFRVAGYIAETLDSVLAQTCQDFEILVVNDGSPDTEALRAALAPYRERILYIEQPQGGPSKARNTAIAAARGDLLAFLDGDDLVGAVVSRLAARHLRPRTGRGAGLDRLRSPSAPVPTVRR